MNRKHKQKLLAVIVVIIMLAAAGGLVLYALKQNINLFYTPQQVLQTRINPQQNLRIGGFVHKHSVHYDASGAEVEFTITDAVSQIQVRFSGVLPNLFREGQGVVVTGKLVDAHHLIASEVLAKHDENYIPRALAESLRG